jgi:hypothetical protein
MGVLKLDPERFLNNVYHENSLTQKLKDVDSIISLKELAGLARQHDNPKLSKTTLDKKELEGIMRSITDQFGNEVYANSKIELVYKPNGEFMDSQSFVQIGKLVHNMVDLNRFFYENFNIVGIAQIGPCFIKLKNNTATYMAFYAPIIIESIDVSYLKEPLEALRERAAREPITHMEILDKSMNVVTKDIELNSLVDTTESVLKKYSNLNKEMHLLIDGTHRGHTAIVAGSPIKKLMMLHTERDQKSIPVDVWDVMLVKDKPERENRFFGIHKKDGKEVGWLKYEEVGMDG